MNIHFIAIGGAIMHALALSMKEKGYQVSGSDDLIFDPAKNNLEKAGLLPKEYGFFEENIHEGLDAVILGMHARKDNIELIKAQKLGIKIYSFPEYIYENSKDKKRIVVSGSHGKTSITSMIMHVLQYAGLEFDYVVGSQLKGFRTNVKISNTAPIIVIEGDEYLSSAIHYEPKFLSYKPHIAIMTGIAWDHINVFPVYEDYVKQFLLFAETIEKNGVLIYNEEDSEVCRVEKMIQNPIRKTAYKTPEFVIEEDVSQLFFEGKKNPLKVIGTHNLQNLMSAKYACIEAGISEAVFYEAIQSFEGALNRLNLIAKNNHTAIYKDFAHSPSKLTATVTAVKKQYKSRKLVAVMELHTYSSLNKDFLHEYAHSMDEADEAIVFFSPTIVALKKLPTIDENDIRKGFERENIMVLSDKNELENILLSKDWTDKNLLMMSSGNFDGLDLKALSEKIV
jgi:UDP-N-acetylmuramate: L-alanyl-gamma-D-glutamyl-meso-diaminopimelate ligase